jgi:hypothetical protein
MDETRHVPNAGPGHETTDVNVWAVGKFMVGLAVVCLISLTLLLGLVKFFQSEQADPQAVKVDPVKLFPQPQLQRTPAVDLRAVRAEEDKLLNGYAWVDPEKGLVRIPIDQAIDILAKRGMPTPKGQKK